MRFDVNNLFHDDTAITTATDYVGDSLDLTAAPLQPGPGEIVRIACIVTEVFASGTSVQAKLVTSAAAALTTPTILYQTPAIVTASLVAGYKFAIPAIPVTALAQRYFGVILTSVGVHTTGKITAGIVMDQQTADHGWPAETGN